MTRYLLFGALTAYLAFVAYYQVFRSHAPEDRSYDQKFFFEKDSLRQLRVHGRQHSLTLEKRKDKWWVTEPVEYLADQEFVEKSIDIMEKVVVENVFRMTEVDYYGFHPGQALIEFIDVSGDRRRFVVGDKEAPQNRLYLLNKDTNEVLVVHNIWGQLLYFPQTMFYSKTIPIPGDQIRRVEFSENGKKLYEIKPSSPANVSVFLDGQSGVLAKSKMLWFFDKMHALAFSDLQKLSDVPTGRGSVLQIETEEGASTYIFDQENAAVYIPSLGLRGRFDPQELMKIIEELKKAVPRDKK